VLLLLATATEPDILAALCSALVLPAVDGRVRNDGTWEIDLGNDLVIRHRPVDDFDARMFLLFLRTIFLPDAPYKLYWFPTTRRNWSIGASTSTIRTSAASRPSRRRSATWRSSSAPIG
jgi:hypothetical protein